MSFKRDGDDSSQLNILKKRRVADLLSNFIPEDEAALMKNGRYTCLVCSYRPVFDTVDMLTVHRKGKRHLEGLKRFYGKKAAFQNELDKRRHQIYVNTEDSKQENIRTAPLLAQTQKITRHALLKATPYNSCHRKTSTKSEKGAGSGLQSEKRTLWYHQSPNETTPDVSTGSAVLPGNASSSAMQLRQHSHAKKKQGGSKGSIPTASPETEKLTEERQRQLEHYLKLKSSGWVQDNCGNWVKDDNVEFDSDEDQPASLLPSS